MLKCQVCEVYFEKVYNNQKYCSKMCSKTIRKIQKVIYDKNYKKKYYPEHKQEYEEYRIKNKQRKKKYDRIYKIMNRDKRNIYEKIRRKNNISYKLLGNLRTRIRLLLKNKWKSGHTVTLLGCSTQFLKEYLEKLFNHGMTWDNYGKWHIDHIRPCASFDLSQESEQRKCFHYTNLQPLWAEENLKKSDKIINN